MLKLILVFTWMEMSSTCCGHTDKVVSDQYNWYTVFSQAREHSEPFFIIHAYMR